MKIPESFAEKHPIASFALMHPFITWFIIDEIACKTYNAYIYTMQAKYGVNSEYSESCVDHIIRKLNESIKKNTTETTDEDTTSEPCIKVEE